MALIASGVREPPRCLRERRSIGSAVLVVTIISASAPKSKATIRERFAWGTGRAGEGMVGLYRTLPPMEIAFTVQYEGTGATRAFQGMMYRSEKDSPVSNRMAGIVQEDCALATLAWT